MIPIGTLVLCCAHIPQLKRNFWVKESLQNFTRSTFNDVHNILRLFDGLANFPLNTGEIKRSVIISNKPVYKICFTSCWTT